tara:strand:+ start:457 stop:705 length:249 start_codon:yes stop_codon:yes gene_type:complete
MNTQYEKLSKLYKTQIDEAIKKVTLKELNLLSYGEEILISENVVLYHYCEDEIIVLNILDEWIEVFQYLWNNNTKKIQIETL